MENLEITNETVNKVKALLDDATFDYEYCGSVVSYVDQIISFMDNATFSFENVKQRLVEHLDHINNDNEGVEEDDKYEFAARLIANDVAVHRLPDNYGWAGFWENGLLKPIFGMSGAF